MKRSRYKVVEETPVTRPEPRNTSPLPRTLKDATPEVLERLKGGDFAVAHLLSRANLDRVGPALVAAATREPTLEPNLSQALGLVGGSDALRLLHQHLQSSWQVPFASQTVEDQYRTVCIARAVLRLRASPRAAMILANGALSSSPRVRRVAARLIAEYLRAGPPLRLERRLLRVLPALLKSDDLSFSSAIGVLLQRHHAPAMARAHALIGFGADDVRRVLVLNLLACDQTALPLLLRALEVERDLELKISVAKALAPVLAPDALSDLLGKVRTSRSPAPRLRGGLLIQPVNSGGRQARKAHIAKPSRAKQKSRR